MGNAFNHNADEELGGRHSRLYRGSTSPQLTEFRQSYALRGLSRATNYEVSINYLRTYLKLNDLQVIIYFNTKMFCDFSAGFEVEMSMGSAPIQMFYTSEHLTLLIKSKTMTLKIQ